ncbi:hypothetical protein [Actinophytocola glycyrrhizae]|uniref:Uncharacterized protein n=1 Tax=Actinophytocola glycyrrhizae TaxID=2044873 RepID=A0ABV9S7X4_9PSEU
MNDLTSFAALQARVYAFLEQQDEATLRAVASGTVRLAVVHADETQGAPPAPADLARTPSHDPAQVARLLPTLASEDERRTYLNETGFTKKELNAVAKALGLRRYSGLTLDKLVNLLVGPGQDQQTPTRRMPSAPQVTKPNADVAAIASRLRETETEEEGAEYLHAQNLDADGLLSVAAALGLTRVNRLRQANLEKRVLKQAIGARRKFDGLRNW